MVICQSVGSLSIVTQIHQGGILYDPHEKLGNITLQELGSHEVVYCKANSSRRHQKTLGCS